VLCFVPRLEVTNETEQSARLGGTQNATDARETAIPARDGAHRSAIDEREDTTVTYRIYTQRFDNLAELTSKFFDGFTLINTQGYWMGQAEDSTIIEIVGDDSVAEFSDPILPRIDALAELIRVTNRQQSVLITTEASTVRYHSADKQAA